MGLDNVSHQTLPLAFWVKGLTNSDAHRADKINGTNAPACCFSILSPVGFNFTLQLLTEL